MDETKANQQMPEADAPGSNPDATKAAANDAWGEPEIAEGADADLLTALEAEVAELKGQHLRDLAEMENVRRRAQRDREEASKFGASSMARDLLTVADNLRRALDSVPVGDARE